VAGTYRLKLTGTGDADLYVKKGAAPTLSSYDCRPYEGGSLEECQVTLAVGETVWYGVHGYATDSKISLGISVPNAGPAEYVYNPAAKRFFHVEMDFTFIVEARPGRTSHVDQASAYSQTKHYEYVLETDEFMKILGGEWVGGSTTDHPELRLVAHRHAVVADGRDPLRRRQGVERRGLGRRHAAARSGPAPRRLPHQQPAVSGPRSTRT
jgi:hypothetical protein